MDEGPATTPRDQPRDYDDLISARLDGFFSHGGEICFVGISIEKSNASH